MQGAWSAPYRPDGTCDRNAATPLRCGSASRLTEASVIVIPYEGAMLGWRNEVSKRFAPPPQVPRSQCFAIDAVMVASGQLDAAILTYGGLWDFAATSLIVTEAGGVFRDAWGGERFDTATGLFTSPGLVEQVLAALAELRPDAPDVPRLARTSSTPIGTEAEQASDELAPIRHPAAALDVGQGPRDERAAARARARRRARRRAGSTAPGRHH